MAESLGIAVVKVLLRRWWIIATSAVVVGVGAYVYATSLPEYYKATVNCVPPRPDNSGITGAVGGLSSALKDFGLTKVGGKSSETYEFVLLFYARSLRDSLIAKYDLAKEYDMVGSPMNDIRDALNDNIEIDYKNEGNYEISVWSRDRNKAVNMTNDVVRMANDLANMLQHQEAMKSAEYLERRLTNLDSALLALQDTLAMYGEKYLLFSPVDQAKAASTIMAAAYEQLTTEEATLDYMTRMYGTNDNTVKAQRSIVEGLRSKITSSTKEPGPAGNLPINKMADVGVRYMRSYAQFEAFTKLKAFLLPTLEQYRLDISKNTVSLLVVDPAIPAEKKDRPKRGLIAAGAAFGAGVTALMVLMLMIAFKRVNQQPAA